MGGLIGAGVGIAVIFSVIGAALVGVLLLGSLFLWGAAKITGIERATFGRSVLVSLVSFVASIAVSDVLGLIFAILPFLAPLSPIVSFVVSVLIIQAMFETSPGKAVVCAHVPLAEMQRYSTDLRSMTQGRGYYTAEFDHFARVPQQLAEGVMAAAAAAAEDEED